MGTTTYRQKVSPLAALIANLSLRREPKKLGHLLPLDLILQKFTNYSHPSCIPICLEQHGVPQRAFEAAHTRANYATSDRGGGGSSSSSPLSWSRTIRCRCGIGILPDPFPRIVIIAEFVVRVFASDGAAGEALSRFILSRPFSCGSHPGRREGMSSNLSVYHCLRWVTGKLFQQGPTRGLISWRDGLRHGPPEVH